MGLNPVNATRKFYALEIMLMTAVTLAKSNNGNCIEYDGVDVNKEETFKPLGL